MAIAHYAELTTVSSFCMWMSRFLSLKYIHTYLYMYEHIETPRVLDPTSIALSLAVSTAHCILGIPLRCIAVFIKLDEPPNCSKMALSNFHVSKCVPAS